MQCMVASSIPCKLSLCADRAHACAGDSYVSSGIDVACPTTQSALAIASPQELHGDSWPSSSTGTRSFCCNHQYSITAITTSTGAVAERYAYTAYGQPTILDASGTVLQTSNFSLRTSYTGREWDATLGLHHFRARWMSPSAGRFLGRDPIGYEGSEWGLYEIFESSSTRFTDPLGLSCTDDYNACDRESEADYRQCVRLGGRMCYWNYRRDQAICTAKFTSCVARANARTIGGICLVGVGGVICCIDTPLPGPADCIGGPVIACGLTMCCSVNTKE